ncbi:hypothetical protein GTW36_09735 [Vibrio parahaemolyticus]|nr:hypothetical protein [Vibrio parahaemolyticus]EGQ9047994.1 hypothetical protein [Vibrio parahaemolyticus]EGQ9146298.1 hypothetical protein [Vibrio parahaemolyticus]EGQ9587367.1 hypothetical protein [Vibrio parahaemolyticus]EGR0999044.1 hypothetical protein [Vibrio parahaemolyticus]
MRIPDMVNPYIYISLGVLRNEHLFMDVKRLR